MPSNIGYPNYDTTTSYNTHAPRHHQDYSIIEKNDYQHQLTSLSSPSPTSSNVIEVSQESIMDLFEKNY